jgi:hypothetical protein
MEFERFDSDERRKIATHAGHNLISSHTKDKRET